MSQQMKIPVKVRSEIRNERKDWKCRSSKVSSGRRIAKAMEDAAICPS